MTIYIERGIIRTTYEDSDYEARNSWSISNNGVAMLHHILREYANIADPSEAGLVDVYIKELERIAMDASECR